VGSILGSGREPGEGEKKVVLEERRKLGRDVLNESPLEDSNYSEL